MEKGAIDSKVEMHPWQTEHPHTYVPSPKIKTLQQYKNLDITAIHNFRGTDEEPEAETKASRI